jgi:hypothetical protein
MGRSRCGTSSFLAVLFSLLWSICGCGGHKPAGTSPYPARITLSPATTVSLQVGTAVNFTATAQNGTNNTLNLPFTYRSSDTSVLTISPTGVACGGQWDSTFSICSGGTIGVAQVTATSLNISSPPTYVFVHPPIDNITVNGILADNQPIQQPCLSQGQGMTVEAHAFSQGSDITSSIGPFTWSANNSAVVTLTPTITNLTYNVATNQATARANTPGVTQIFASASGVTSNTFAQPQNPGGPTVLLDFFETCPIQNIRLELGPAGSQQSGQTSFVTTKGGATQTVTAVVTDVMGNTSLAGANTPVQLSKIPLTWSASQPGAVGVPSTCAMSCNLTIATGAGSVTASCSPPACNIGYPLVPAIFSSPTCAQSLQVSSCEQFIPVPVYATIPISGVVTGTTSAPSVLATSSGCAATKPLNCSTAIYNVSASKSVAGAETQLPSSPNSLMFDLTGDKAVMGSQLAAISINPGNLGTSTNPFTSLGAVTGKVIAVSNTGTLAAFSDATLTPNQVFVTNSGSGTAPVSAFSIQGQPGIPVAAAFSPDNLKGFIFGFDPSGIPNLYVYSTLQSIQTACWSSTGACAPMPSGTTIRSFVFSANSAFVYALEPSLAGGGPAISVFNLCNNRLFTDTVSGNNFIPLSATPVAFKALPDGIHFIVLENNGTFDYITATVTEIPVATVSSPATSICPLTVGHTVTNISLNQGVVNPLDFFMSADGTLMYVVASDRATVLVYNFLTGATTGIELAGNAVPVKAGMSPDAGTIIIAANDGKLHQVTTGLGGADLSQIPFPNLPNYTNPFCTDPTANCTADLIAVKP